MKMKSPHKENRGKTFATFHRNGEKLFLKVSASDERFNELSGSRSFVFAEKSQKTFSMIDKPTSESSKKVK